MHIYHHARSAAHSDKLILHSVRAHILRHDLWSYAYAGIDNNIFFKKRAHIRPVNRELYIGPKNHTCEQLRYRQSQYQPGLHN